MTQIEAATEFHDFVQARWAYLVRCAYLLTGDPMHAEDAVQVALERTWRRWRQVVTDRPEAYVRTAIARAAISRHRARRRRVAESPLDGAPVPAAPTGGEGPQRVDLGRRTG
ncbi:MAG TPA: sigma factor [Kineosporiaceae bacterium]|nr:sigma factor [Kineosporiaceae bacterium]